jgi:hypothetical protein
MVRFLFQENQQQYNDSGNNDIVIPVYWQKRREMEVNTRRTALY